MNNRGESPEWRRCGGDGKEEGPPECVKRKRARGLSLIQAEVRRVGRKSGEEKEESTSQQFRGDDCDIVSEDTSRARVGKAGESKDCSPEE